MAVGPLSTIERSFMRYTNFSVLDPRLPYTIATDASGTVVGGVLMQDQGDML